MKLDLIANSKNDEYRTPNYAVTPLLPYIPPGSAIWCPFDRADSAYVQLFQKHGNRVVHSHIRDGGDFFRIECDECDYIISNPPYSKKTEVLERLFEMGKPFAMLVCVVGLFESQKRFRLFRDSEFEIMYFNHRISFYLNEQERDRISQPPFSSVYVCRGVLPKQIVFAELSRQ